MEMPYTDSSSSKGESTHGGGLMPLVERPATISYLLIALIVAATMPGLHAQEISERVLDNTLTRKIKECPEKEIAHAHICQDILRSCAAHVTRECDERGSACLKRESALNAKILAYNSIYHKCQGARANSGNSKQRENSLLRLKPSEDKAVNVDTINSTERQGMDQRQDINRQEDADRNTRIRQDPDDAQRARLDEQRKNGEAQQAVDAARERQQQLDQERTQRELAQAKKSHCFVESDADAPLCSAACYQFYPASSCNDRCTASNPSRIPTKPYCFAEP
jgi:hypothetical protein